MKESLWFPKKRHSLWNRRLSLSLSAKLTLGFVIVLLIFSAFSVFTHLQLKQLAEEDDARRALSERQQTALALRTHVQQMDAAAAGFMLSNNPELAKQYKEAIPELTRLIEAVGASAETRNQRNWRARLTTVAKEFTGNFESTSAKLQESTLDSEHRQRLMFAAYNASQIHKQTIFELVQSFYDEYTAADVEARHQFADFIRQTGTVMRSATIAAIVIAVLVATYIVRSLTSGIRQLRQGIERMQRGDLSEQINTDKGDELGRLSDSFDASVAAVRVMLEQTKTIAQSLKEHSRIFQVFTGSTKETNAGIVRAMEEIAAGASKQAELTEASVTAIGALEDRMNGIISAAQVLFATTEDAKLSVKDGTGNVQELRQRSTHTGKALQTMADALSRLEGRSAEIASITNLIQNISKQTNILALNAAIESARAGEHGRGFAVIAEEVRLLSLQSAASSKRISDILSQLRSGVHETSVTLRFTADSFMEQQIKVKETEIAFETIVRLIDVFDLEIRRIGERVHEARQKQTELVKSIQVVTSVAQETAASVQETAAAATSHDRAVGQVALGAQEIQGLAESLFGEINKFKM